MTIREIIQRIQSLYSKGVQSDDSRLTNRHIFNKLQSTNNLFLSRKLDKREIISNSAYTDLDCLNIVEDNIINCPCIQDLSCKIYRTECKIPEILTSKQGLLIKSVMSLDGNIKINYTTFEDLKYLSGNKYTAKKMWYFIKDNYFYFVNTKKMKAIRISAIFKNMLEALTYSCGNMENCIDFLDLPFATDDSLIEDIIGFSANELINTFSQVLEDVTNDSKDSHIQQIK